MILFLDHGAIPDVHWMQLCSNLGNHVHCSGQDLMWAWFTGLKWDAGLHISAHPVTTSLNTLKQHIKNIKNHPAGSHLKQL